MMKKYSYHGRNVFILLITCLLLISPVSSEARTRRYARESDSMQQGDAARLIIHRISVTA